MSENKRDHIVISYHRADEHWLRQLLEYLQPIVLQEKQTIWLHNVSDRVAAIDAEFYSKLSHASILVLLVSVDYLASEGMQFVLNSAMSERVEFSWLAARPAAYQQIPLLRERQPLGDPHRPLALLSESEVERALVKVSRHIADFTKVAQDAQFITIPPVEKQLTRDLKARRNGVIERIRNFLLRVWRAESDDTFAFKLARSSLLDGYCRLRLELELDKLKEKTIERIINKLTKLINYNEIDLDKIELGSIILKLRCSEEGFAILNHLYKNGQLTKALGISILSLDWIEEDFSFGSMSGADSDSISTSNSERNNALPRRKYLYYSYATEDARLRIKLEMHLAMLKHEGVIEDWNSQKIGPGLHRKIEIHHKLSCADVILLLISPYFISSEECFNEEMKQALKQHEIGRSRVVPLLLRPTDWKTAPFAQLQYLPRNGKAITSWRNREDAWLHVVENIRQVVSQT